MDNMRVALVIAEVELADLAQATHPQTGLAQQQILDLAAAAAQ